MFFGATLDRADLANADLSSVLGLTQDQLATAYGNRGTRLPAAFAEYVMQEKPADSEDSSIG